ncbi:hypothetical protein P4O66_021259 [Electrophorus voltai]|uniref:Pentacotripeptide-repeat region of PRORP domain-containing protein n=1 Tax=Electrophorus voltai TaxID=2609070 RepID=A0AAD8ZNU5_9TELE|nr:hypothetical protein P4O66_021259 [Electrophorus voltai]
MLRCVLLKSLQAGSNNVSNLVRVAASVSNEIRPFSAYISDQSWRKRDFQSAQRCYCDSVQFRATRKAAILHDTRSHTTSGYTEEIENTDEGADHDQFGEYGGNFSSRTSFRKTSAEQQDLKYRDTREDDSVVKKFKSKTGRRNTQYWYFLQCKKLIKKDKLAEALALFEGDMLEGERLQPEEYNYTVLIGGCGRVGYVKKAFQLYNNMKKRGLEPSDATYTALFNACSESPWKQTGLEQALRLRQELRRKNILLTAITQHALLKTFALAGDMKACFQVLREMLQNGQPITQETFQYLLMCCVEDKQQGFRLALQVWYQMLNAGLKPDTKNYNLLLRAARDCGIGDLTLASTLLLKEQKEPAQKESPQRSGQRSKVSEWSPSSKPLDMDMFESHLFAAAMSTDSHELDTAPLGQWQHGDRPSEVESPSGGDTDAPAEHCFSVHTSDSTWQTQLMPVSPKHALAPCPPSSPSVSPSSRPLNLLDPSTCHPDVVALGTVNSASDRLALMGNLEGFLNKMATDGLSPTIKTLTLLADVMEPSSQSVQSLISVAKQNQVKLDVAFFNTLIRKFAKAGDLEGAKACGVGANVHIFSALIGQASRRLDYAYLHELLQQMHRLQVPPNEVIIRQLEFVVQYPPTYDKFKSKNTYLEKIDGFRGFYKEWLKFMPGQETPHPWDKYRLQQTEDQHYGTESQSNETTKVVNEVMN